MASSCHLSFHTFVVVKEWYKIRDTFLGQNCVSQNFSLALELAGACKHPEAQWLTRICTGKKFKSREEAQDLFLSFGETDARAQCFSWCLGARDDVSPLWRSAELGYAFGQAQAALEANGEDRFKYAKRASEQLERDGFLLLGWCFQNGFGCEQDFEKEKQNFCLAAEHGSVQAMNECGAFLDESDPQRWHWWGLAASLGDPCNFHNEFVKCMQKFDSVSKNPAVVFAIGKALKGHVSVVTRTIFEQDFGFESRIVYANQAIAFHDAQIRAARLATETWTLVGIRLKIAKDVRILIAKLVWGARTEADYP